MGSKPGQRVLRCEKCGRTIACSSADLMKYVKDGWPKCCGETMAFFAEPAPPISDPPTPPPDPSA